MTRVLGHPLIQQQDYVLPVLKGGTGSNTAQGAASKLLLVSQSQKGAPNGVAGLDAQGKLQGSVLSSSSEINLTGSLDAYVSTPLVLTISDFDDFKTYTLSVTVGTVSRSGATITYNPPATPQNVTLTINGRQLAITVNDSQPAKPTIQSPTAGAINVNETPTIQASAFVSLGVAQTHASTDWQVATDVNFTNVVQNFAGDTVNKVSRKLNALATNTQYFVRVRYNSNLGKISQWSNTVSFTTKSVFIPNVESAKLTSDLTTGNGQFGFCAHISADGTRMVVGAPYGTDTLSQQGVAYVFFRNNGTWQLERKIVSSTPRSGGSGYFGESVRIDATGTRVFIAETNAIDSGTSGGAIEVYTRSGTTWTYEARLTCSSTLASNYGVGWNMDISSDGSVVVSGQHNTVVVGSGVSGSSGCVFTWTRSGTTWSSAPGILQATAPDRYNQANFGTVKTLSPNGNTLILGMPNCADGSQEPAGAPGTYGAIFIYTRSGTNWNLSTKRFAPTLVQGEYFGAQVVFNRTGTRFAVRSGSSTGKVRIYDVNSSVPESEINTGNVGLSDFATNNYTGRMVPDMYLSDDYATLIVGMPSTPMGAMNSVGKVVIYKRSGTTWTRTGAVTASDAAASDYYGSCVTATGEVDQLISGSPQSDPGGLSNKGAVYVLN